MEKNEKNERLKKLLEKIEWEMKNLKKFVPNEKEALEIYNKIKNRVKYILKLLRQRLL